MPGHYFIYPDDDCWVVAHCSDDGVGTTTIKAENDRNAEECVAEVCRVMSDSGYSSDPAILIVPSKWCAASSISVTSVPRSDRQTAMVYALEEKLPISAEQFVAGFIHNASGAFGVCVFSEKVRPIVDQFESSSIFVHSILPAAMIATQEALRKEKPLQADMVVWITQEWCDVITIDRQQQAPSAWASIPNDSDTIRALIDMSAIQGCRLDNIIVYREEEHAIEKMLVETDNTIEISVHDQDMLTVATDGARHVLDGQMQPWIDIDGVELGASSRLRRILKPLKASMAAAVLLLLMFNAAVIWRAHSYQLAAYHDMHQQRVVFIELFPDQRVPQAVDKRLASEYSKINGTRGRSQALPAPPVTLTLMHHILNRLPSDIRFRLTEIRIEDDSIYMDGQARSHRDVGTIANALGMHGDSLTVETRHTEQLSDGSGVGFVVVAWPTPKSDTVTMK